MSVNNNQERMMNKEPATDIPELMDNARNMLGEVSIGEGTMCWDGAGEVLFVGMEKTRDDGMVGVDAVLESTTTTVFRRNNRQAWGIVYKFCSPILLLNTVVSSTTVTVQSEGPPGPLF
jgi:hypothetical protein